MLLEIKYSFSLRSNNGPDGHFALVYDGKYKFWYIYLLDNGLWADIFNPCKFRSPYKAIGHAKEMLQSAYKRMGISYKDDWEIEGIDGLDKVLALTKAL